MPPRRANDGLTIQAAVLRRAGGPLAIETLALDAPRADEALVRLVASGICRTDVDIWEAGAGAPVVLGHEGAGVVEAVGRRMTAVAPGDHVVLSYQSCGGCPACAADRPAHCDRFWPLNFGFQRADGSNALAASGASGHFFGQSSFATHTLATERNMVRVAKRLPLATLAPLGCGLQTGAGTVMNSLAVRAGESLAVFGAGSVGLAAVMAGRVVGARPIVAIDRNPRRLPLARELGATHAIDLRGQDALKRMRAIVGRRGLDHALDTTGDAALQQAAAALLAPGGRLALLTGEGGRDLPGGRKAIGIIQGDAVPQRFIPCLIRLWREGRFPFDRLVRFYPFAGIDQAIADMQAGLVVKPVLRIGPVRSPSARA